MRTRNVIPSAIAIAVGMGGLYATGAVAQAAPPPANAVSQPASAVGEITVVAQKRSENIQNVPIAVSVATAAQIANIGIQSTQDLQIALPGLQTPTTSGFLLLHMRGVGSTALAPGNENSVSLYVDGVYIASAPGSILSLNNISQVEALKGPQGTLFGRNATGGVLLITTREPDSPAPNEFSVGYGNYDTTTASLYAHGAVAPDLFGDIALQGSHQGEGYGKNIFTGHDVYKDDVNIAARSKWLWKPSDNLTVHVGFDFEREEGSMVASNQVPGTLAEFGTTHIPQPWDVDQDFNPKESSSSGGVYGRIDYDFGGVKLTNITAYRDLNYYDRFDYDGTPNPTEDVKLTVNSSQITEEAELQSSKPSKLQWSVGLFYFHAEDSISPFELDLLGAYQAAAGLSSVSIADTETTNSIAGFAQATYEIFPETHLTGGLRYSYEKRDLTASEVAVLAGSNASLALIPSYASSISFEKPTWRLALDHRFSSELLAYVTYNRGYKSGGFNLLSPTDAPYNPEVLDAYEIGFKADLFDRRVRFNPSIFYYNYSNIQVSEYIRGGESIYNGARARLYGLDLDIDAVLTDQLTLHGGLEYLNATFTSFPNAVISTPLPMGGFLQTTGDATGNHLPDAPPFTATMTFDFKVPSSVIPNNWGDLLLSTTYAYNSGFYTEPDNHLHQNSYTDLSASVLWTLPNQRFTVRAWARNLTDAVIAENLATATQTTSRELFAPRTFGVTLGAKF
jgi:outer membrane receptor protein involved in Fe transport